MALKNFRLLRPLDIYSMKKLYIVAITFFFAANVFAQNPTLSWLNTIGGSGSDYIRSMCSDPSGNIYIAGTFNQTVDFDPSGAIVSRTAVGADDGFVAKFNSVGQLLWVSTLGGSSNDWVTSIAADNNNVYATGFFIGTANFNPSGSTTKTSNSNTGDMFLVKYNSGNGSLAFVNTFGGSGGDYGGAIVLDPSSNIYVAGAFQTTMNFDPTVAASAARTSRGDYDMFLAKYSSTGAFQWVSAIGTIEGADYAETIAWDATSSSIWIGGSYSGVLHPDPNSESVTLSSAGNSDGYYGNYNSGNGELLWGGSVASAGVDYVSAIAPTSTGVYVGGYFTGTATILGDGGNRTVTSSDQDAFLFNIDTYSHEIAWVNSFGGVGLDYLNGITTSYGNVCIAGSFAATMDVDPSTNQVLLTNSTASFNPYFIKYNSADGRYVSSMTMGGAGDDEPADIINVNGAIYWGGIFEGTNVDLDPGVGSNTRTSLGSYDLFLSRLNATEPPAAPTGFNAGKVTGNATELSFTAPAVAPDGYIVLSKAGSAPTGVPVDGAVYSSASTIGDSYVQGIIMSPSIAVGGLNTSSDYFFAIYPFNGSGTGINFKNTSPLTGQITTTSGIPEPSSQPTNLTFSKVMAYGFDFAFSAAVGANITGYLGVRSTNAAPVFVPQDGLTYAEGTTVLTNNNEVISFMRPGTAYYYDDNLDANTKYYFKIYAYNQVGDDVNYLQLNPLAGNVTTLNPSNDTTGPVIDDQSPDKVTPNSSLTLTIVTTDDNAGVSSVKATVYPINSVSSEVFDLVKSEDARNTWTVAVPSKYSADQGFEYLITSTDYQGNATKTDLTPVILSYTGTGLSIAYSSGTDQSNYRIIAIPLDLDNNSASAVFDEFQFDKTKMRLFRYNGSDNSELSGSDKIKIGEGYWFIASESKSLTSGGGTTALVGDVEPFYIKVNNGWNQIGNPYNFNLPWSWVTNSSDNDDKVFGKLKTFEGSWNESATELKKMTGAFVMIQDKGDGNLRIPVYDQSGSRIPAPVNFKQSLASNTWAVDLHVKSGAVENSFAGFGMHPDASEQNDRFDDFTLPRFMDYLELNYNKKLFGSSFTRDIVPTSSKHVWEFEVESNLGSNVVELTWDNSYLGSTNLKLVLWDVAQQRAIDMKSESSYAFERSLSKNFRIFYGDEAFVKAETLPFRAVFHSASPVPSSGNVTFAFSIPESSGNTKTNLTVYSVMGQKVANLIDNTLPAGYHQAVWNIEDGAKPAVGVYISVLKYGDTTLQKRIVIK